MYLYKFLAELTTVVFYGFLILFLALYWPNEANIYLLFFCFSNGILALIGAYNPKEECELCRWNGILSKLGTSKIHFHSVKKLYFIIFIPIQLYSR